MDKERTRERTGMQRPETETGVASSKGRKQASVARGEIRKVGGARSDGAVYHSNVIPFLVH